jgi:hypothetical protein
VDIRRAIPIVESDGLDDSFFVEDPGGGNVVNVASHISRDES